MTLQSPTQTKRDFVRQLVAERLTREVKAEKARVDDEPANRLRADYDDYQDWCQSEGRKPEYLTAQEYDAAV